MKRDQYLHNIQKAKRQAQADRDDRLITLFKAIAPEAPAAPELAPNVCAMCQHVNPVENWGCDACGAPLDLMIDADEYGLPIIVGRPAHGKL